MRYWLPLIWLAGFALVGVLSVAPTMLANGAANSLQDTYYVVVNVPGVMSVGALFVFFAAVYAFFQRFTGVAYSLRLALIHLASAYLAILLISAAPLWFSTFGTPDRHIDYPQLFAVWNGVQTAGYACILLSGLAFLAVLFEALRRRRRR